VPEFPVISAHTPVAFLHAEAKRFLRRFGFVDSQNPHRREDVQLRKKLPPLWDGKTLI
jgi:hypothetical protein